jgi:hypothetical protein
MLTSGKWEFSFASFAPFSLLLPSFSSSAQFPDKPKDGQRNPLAPLAPLDQRTPKAAEVPVSHFITFF